MDAYIQSKDCRDSRFMDAQIHGRLHLMLLPCGEFWHPKTHVLMQKRSATAVGDSGRCTRRVPHCLSSCSSPARARSLDVAESTLNDHPLSSSWSCSGNCHFSCLWASPRVGYQSLAQSWCLSPVLWQAPMCAAGAVLPVASRSLSAKNIAHTSAASSLALSELRPSSSKTGVGDVAQWALYH